MKEEKVSKKTELKHRMYLWTLTIARMIDTLPHTQSTDVMARQLMRSGTSVCANYIEAQAASSKRDFINYLHISLKSANETKYWLALLRDLKKVKREDIDRLLDEVEQISRILGASLVTLKKKT